MASSSAGQFGLVVDLRVELTGRLPEASQRPLATCVIPHTRCDNAARSGHAGHFAESFDRCSHEVNDELRQRGVEVVVRERELLGSRMPHIDSWVAFSGSRDERHRGVDSGHDGRA